MQNQSTEGRYEIVKEIDSEIESVAKMTSVTKITRYTFETMQGPWVRNMRQYILSDICIVLHDKSIPTLKECQHIGTKRCVDKKFLKMMM